MKKMKLVHYSDPSHGWYRVPLKLIKQLGIKDKISEYSFINGSSAYLEEDCDVRVFLRAYLGKELILSEDITNAFDLVHKYKTQSSIIRNFASFSSSMV